MTEENGQQIVNCNTIKRCHRKSKHMWPTFVVDTLYNNLCGERYSRFRLVSLKLFSTINPIPINNATNTTMIKILIAPVRKAMNPIMVFKKTIIRAIRARRLPTAPAAFNVTIKLLMFRASPVSVIPS